MKVAEKVIPKRFDPIRAIEWVIAIFTLAGGVYTLSPLQNHSAAANGPGIISQVTSSSASVTAFAILLIVSAICIMIGGKVERARIRSFGLFTLMLVRVFQIVSVFVVQGWAPVSGWLYLSTVVGVLLMLWVHARIEVRRYVS